MRIPLRVPSPRPRSDGATVYVGTVTPNGLEVYQHGSKEHVSISVPRLMTLLAATHQMSVREFHQHQLALQSSGPSALPTGGATNGQQDHSPA